MAFWSRCIRQAGDLHGGGPTNGEPTTIHRATECSKGNVYSEAEDLSFGTMWCGCVVLRGGSLPSCICPICIEAPDQLTEAMQCGGRGRPSEDGLQDQQISSQTTRCCVGIREPRARCHDARLVPTRRNPFIEGIRLLLGDGDLLTPGWTPTRSPGSPRGCGKHPRFRF